MIQILMILLARKGSIYLLGMQKMAYSPPLMHLGRALLKKYRIVFPIKVKGENGQDVPEAEGHWVPYNLSGEITGKRAVNSMQAEGSTFWVKFELYPPYEEWHCNMQGRLLRRPFVTGFHTIRQPGL